MVGRLSIQSQGQDNKYTIVSKNKFILSRIIHNFSNWTEDRVFALILGRSSLRGFCLFIFTYYNLTIGKKNRSKTLSLVAVTNFMNNQG